MLLPKAKTVRSCFQNTFHCQLRYTLFPFEGKGNIRVLLNTKANGHPSDLKVRESCFPRQMTLGLLQGQDHIFQV